MTDFLLLEQIHKLISELKKPRLMFRKGICARGYFQPYMSFSEYTDAELFQGDVPEFPVTVRFSSMLGDAGTADTMRNLRGMSIRFHGREAIHDMICSSLPVFFIHEMGLFPQLHKALTVQESFDRIEAERFWRFVVEHPEALNSALRLYSSCGLGESYLNIRWYEVNPCIWQKDEKDMAYVRCQWRPLSHQEKPVFRSYAEFLAGFDPHRAGNELRRCIGEGNFPVFEMMVQMVDPECYRQRPEYQRRTLQWEESSHPATAIGIMKLTEIAEDDRDRTLTDFAPGNTMPGISLCGDEFSGMMDYLYRRSAAERGCI